MEASHISIIIFSLDNPITTSEAPPKKKIFGKYDITFSAQSSILPNFPKKMRMSSSPAKWIHRVTYSCWKLINGKSGQVGAHHAYPFPSSIFFLHLIFLYTLGVVLRAPRRSFFNLLHPQIIMQWCGKLCAKKLLYFQGALLWLILSFFLLTHFSPSTQDILFKYIFSPWSPAPLENIRTRGSTGYYLSSFILFFSDPPPQKYRQKNITSKIMCVCSDGASLFLLHYPASI